MDEKAKAKQLNKDLRTVLDAVVAERMQGKVQAPKPEAVDEARTRLASASGLEVLQIIMSSPGHFSARILEL